MIKLNFVLHGQGHFEHSKINFHQKENFKNGCNRKWWFMSHIEEQRPNKPSTIIQKNGGVIGQELFKGRSKGQISYCVLTKRQEWC